jgi:hypothetical protein
MEAQMRIRPAWLATIELLFLFFCLPAAAQTSEGTMPAAMASINVNEHRPVAGALQILAKRHGFAITYEDPVDSHVSDLATLPRVSPRDVGLPVIVPTGGAFDFHYAVENGKPQEDTGTTSDPHSNASLRVLPTPLTPYLEKTLAAIAPELP